MECYGRQFYQCRPRSDPKITGSIAAEFSNYGKNNVDVFARACGCFHFSRAEPVWQPDGHQHGRAVVTGLAALIRSYYPSLTAAQVKQVIDESALKPDASVIAVKPGTKTKCLLPR